MGPALSSCLPLPALLLLQLQCPQQWQEQHLDSECLQRVLKTPPKLKPERSELGIHGKRGPTQKTAADLTAAQQSGDIAAQGRSVNGTGPAASLSVPESRNQPLCTTQLSKINLGQDNRNICHHSTPSMCDQSTSKAYPLL